MLEHVAVQVIFPSVTSIVVIHKPREGLLKRMTKHMTKHMLPQ